MTVFLSEGITIQNLTKTSDQLVLYSEGCSNTWAIISKTLQKPKLTIRV